MDEIATTVGASGLGKALSFDDILEEKRAKRSACASWYTERAVLGRTFGVFVLLPVFDVLTDIIFTASIFEHECLAVHPSLLGRARPLGYASLFATCCGVLSMISRSLLLRHYFVETGSLKDALKRIVVVEATRDHSDCCPACDTEFSLEVFTVLCEDMVEFIVAFVFAIGFGATVASAMTMFISALSIAPKGGRMVYALLHACFCGLCGQCRSARPCITGLMTLGVFGGLLTAVLLSLVHATNTTLWVGFGRVDFSASVTQDGTRTYINGSFPFDNVMGLGGAVAINLVDGTITTLGSSTNLRYCGPLLLPTTNLVNGDDATLVVFREYGAVFVPRLVSSTLVQAGNIEGCSFTYWGGSSDTTYNGEDLVGMGSSATHLACLDMIRETGECTVDIAERFVKDRESDDTVCAELELNVSLTLVSADVGCEVVGQVASVREGEVENFAACHDEQG